MSPVGVHHEASPMLAVVCPSHCLMKVRLAPFFGVVSPCCSRTTSCGFCHEQCRTSRPWWGGGLSFCRCVQTGPAFVSLPFASVEDSGWLVEALLHRLRDGTNGFPKSIRKHCISNASRRWRSVLLRVRFPQHTSPHCIDAGVEHMKFCPQIYQVLRTIGQS